MAFKTSRRRLLIALTVSLMAVASATTAHLAAKESDQLNVLFPVSLLKRDASLIDVSNLDTIYSYYLAENLAAGLVRDDINDPSGFRPVLAERWRQVDPRSWEFLIRRDNAWSDGRPLTGQEIARHFSALIGRPTRHLVQLASLVRAAFDDQRDTLVLEFSNATTSTLLNELSLADAAILTEANRSESWTVTSGPYSTLR